MTTLYHFRFGRTKTGKDFGGRHYGTKAAGKSRADSILRMVEEHFGPMQGRKSLGVLTIEKRTLAPGARIYAREAPLDETTGEYKILEVEGSTARRELEEQGYQGVAYVNAVEDPGSTSYLIWDPRALVEPSGTRRSRRPPKPRPTMLRAMRRQI
jgi:hypothetical protein